MARAEQWGGADLVLQIKEPIPIPGGTLIATTAGWKLEFAFAGPDLRYSPTLVALTPGDVDRLTAAYPAAFRRYLQMRAGLSSPTEASEAFDHLLTIRISDFADGVCLGGYHAPVRSEGELELRLAVLRDVSARGAALVAAAIGLGR